MLQFLCLQMCVYGGSAVPQGGVGDRHLVTIPQGVVGDRLPWGGERQGGGRVLPSAALATFSNRLPNCFWEPPLGPLPSAPPRANHNFRL